MKNQYCKNVGSIRLHSQTTENSLVKCLNVEVAKVLSTHHSSEHDKHESEPIIHRHNSCSVRYIIRAHIYVSAVRHEHDTCLDEDVLGLRAVPLHQQHQEAQSVAEIALSAVRHRDDRSRGPIGQPDVGVRLGVGFGQTHGPGALHSPLHPSEIRSGFRIADRSDF